MKSSKKSNNVVITLSSDESLILLDWLSKFNGNKSQAFDHESEQKVLWNLESILEEQVSDTFKDDYLEILSKARKKIE